MRKTQTKQVPSTGSRKIQRQKIQRRKIHREKKLTKENLQRGRFNNGRLGVRHKFDWNKFDIYWSQVRKLLATQQSKNK